MSLVYLETKLDSGYIIHENKKSHLSLKMNTRDHIVCKNIFLFNYHYIVMKKQA